MNCLKKYPPRCLLLSVKMNIYISIAKTFKQVWFKGKIYQQENGGARNDFKGVFEENKKEIHQKGFSKSLIFWWIVKEKRGQVSLLQSLYFLSPMLKKSFFYKFSKKFNFLINCERGERAGVCVAILVLFIPYAAPK